MRLYIGNPQDREALAMMLSSHVESGFAAPQARSALAKLRKVKRQYASIDFTQEEVQAIYNVQNSFLTDSFWTPTGYPSEYGGYIQPYEQNYPPSWLRNRKTPYLTPEEEKILYKEILEERKGEDPRFGKLEGLGVPMDQIEDLLEETHK